MFFTLEQRKFVFAMKYELKSLRKYMGLYSDSQNSHYKWRYACILRNTFFSKKYFSRKFPGSSVTRIFPLVDEYPFVYMLQEVNSTSIEENRSKIKAAELRSTHTTLVFREQSSNHLATVAQ